MSLLSFCEWLAATPGSIALHESHYLYLIVLTVHVMTLCVFAGTAVLLNLRLVGVTMLSVPVSELMARRLPWTVAGFAVMVISGSLLFYAAPLDKYGNLFFRTKMGLLVLAGLNVWAFYKTAYRSVVEWDSDPVPPGGARVAGCAGLILLAAIIAAGRMIPYQTYWFE